MSSESGMRRTDMDNSAAVAADADHMRFERASEPHRHELIVHCYRMLGSIEDAEDAVQETYLRAWRRLDSFAGRSSFRAWLYGIATHTCLDMLRRRKSRVWPTDLSGPAEPGSEPASPAEISWLQPVPDALLALAAPVEDEPEAAVAAKETIELAFLTAIQRLPPRQRAVLILRDVLDWSSKEAAATLETSVAAVNSALQRARAGLAEDALPDANESPTRNRADALAAEKRILQQLVDAWQRADIAGIVSLLRDDAKLVMPPRPTWFAGSAAIEVFFRNHVFGPMGDGWRLIPTAANRQPAFALYWRPPGDTRFRAFAIGVLTIKADAEPEAVKVSELAIFAEPSLFDRFAMPAAL